MFVLHFGLSVVRFFEYIFVYFLAVLANCYSEISNMAKANAQLCKKLAYPTLANSVIKLGQKLYSVKCMELGLFRHYVTLIYNFDSLQLRNNFQLYIPTSDTEPL